jgi:hypothetical protein
MDFRTFSMPSVEFSTVKMGIFGDLVLILFYSYSGNRKTFVLITSLLFAILLLYDWKKLATSITTDKPEQMVRKLSIHLRILNGERAGIVHWI